MALPRTIRAHRRLEQPMPRRIRPMLPVLAGGLPADPDHYSFEYKWDGIRALCYWDGRDMRLESRNQLDITHRYPELRILGEALGSRRAILDGEIVALDANDRPSFPRLQRRMHVEDRQSIERLARQVPAWYIIFDLLYLDGGSTIDLTYIERRDLLEELTLLGSAWRISPAERGAGRALLDSARQLGLEGIVAKRNDSAYEIGRRSPAWLKIKLVSREELVVGGWIPEAGDPRRIGSLLVGYYEPGRRGGLRYAGRVGSGFDARWHRDLVPRLGRLQRSGSPFADQAGLPGVRFVEPRLVAEVEYRRWPPGGLIQQAAFKGLRTDKPPRQVIPERACIPNSEAR